MNDISIKELVDEASLESSYISYRISRICEDRGISQRTIEIGAGIGNGAISKWRSSTPTVKSIIKVANYLDVSIDLLVGREGCKCFENATKEKKTLLNSFNDLKKESLALDEVEKTLEYVLELCNLIKCSENQSIEKTLEHILAICNLTIENKK